MGNFLNNIWQGNLNISGSNAISGSLNVTTPAVSGAETLASFNVSDASTNDFLNIQNTTSTAASFVPGLWSRQNSGNLPSLYLVQQVPDNVTTNAAFVVDCRTPSGTVLTNRPLMVVRNFTTPVLTVEANSNLRLNGGALVFPDTAKTITGGAGAVMNINSGGNSMVFRQTSSQFMRGNSGGVGIQVTASDATINPSAILTLTATNKGFLPPVMTTAQRDAISSPAAGLMIYNSDVNKHQGYDGTTWNDFY